MHTIFKIMRWIDVSGLYISLIKNSFCRLLLLMLLCHKIKIYRAKNSDFEIIIRIYYVCCVFMDGTSFKVNGFLQIAAQHCYKYLQKAFSLLRPHLNHYDCVTGCRWNAENVGFWGKKKQKQNEEVLKGAEKR